MDGYKYCAQNGVRFNTPMGALPVERLFQLDKEILNKLAVSLDTEVETKVKSFLAKAAPSKQSVENKIKLDVVIDVIRTIEAKEEAAAKRKARKDSNKQLLEIIADKQNTALKNKPIEELLAMLEEED